MYGTFAKCEPDTHVTQMTGHQTFPVGIRSVILVKAIGFTADSHLGLTVYASRDAVSRAYASCS